MDVIASIILGFVQGITEFLPISSTGHLILTESILDFSGEGTGLAFDAVLHLATALAVVVYFFDDIRTLVRAVLRKMGRLPVDAADLTLAYALMVGTIPAVVFGMLLESYMESLFRNPLLVAGVLFLGSLLFIVGEYYYQNHTQQDRLRVRTGFTIGLFQALALFPGMSRSGATIVGGMFCGLSRSAATRFAFLLAVPVILGAGAKKVLDLLSLDTAISWGPIVLGAVAAFVVGLLAIRFMLGFVRRYTLWPFIWYRIILSVVIVFVVFFG
ncbi:undecaprenyl-diphosphatase UppP [Candidatus Kaiserbacteria bacterium]|nr:undecaprenyl-diphosphatase UppP [Candidatus Kaiserbacteria bacterium]